MLCNVIPVHSYLNSNHTTYLTQTVPPIVYVLENFHRKFANLVAPPIDGTTKHLVLCKCISSVRRCKQRPNRSTIGDAILPQSATKLTKRAVRNLTVCCGAIWCRREKSQYGCTTTCTFLCVHNSLKDIFENLLSVWLSGRTNLFVPSHFWTTCTNFVVSCQRYI